MMNKMQAMLWFGSITGKLEMKGHKSGVGDDGFYAMPSPRSWIRMVYGDFNNKTVWWIEFSKHGPINKTKVTPALEKKFTSLLESDYPDWKSEIGLASDELGAAIVTCTMQFHDKQGFNEFIDYISQLEEMTHQIAEQLS